MFKCLQTLRRAATVSSKVAAVAGLLSLMLGFATASRAQDYTATVSVPTQTYSTTDLLSPVVAGVSYNGPQPTGGVLIQLDGNTLFNAPCAPNMDGSSMTCTLDYPTLGLPSLPHQIKVYLLPDSNYPSGAYGLGSLVPGVDERSVAITIPPQTASTNASVIAVSGIGVFQTGVFPMGSVVMTIDGIYSMNAACSLTSYSSASCMAQVPVQGLSVGTHVISVYIAGDSNYDPSRATGMLTVQ